MSVARIILRPRRARPFYGQHPWVFPGAIERVDGDPADGAEVDLVSHTGNFVARGLFNSRSKIRVRLYSWSPEPIGESFFRQRLDAALRLRGPILGLDGPGRACRLVFSEADGLSGLTVDRFDRWLVVQFTSLALAQRRELLADLLAERLKPEGIYLRTERGIGRLEGLELQDTSLRGQVPTEPIPVEENGMRFLVDLTEGQKTGFYLDQRDNRQAVSRLAAGRRVLDAFCYSGGFGVAAGKAGARDITGVDVSEAALALADANYRLNGLSGLASLVRGDVFDQLDALVGEGQHFGMVVLDPPKFARAQHAVDDALRGYRHLQTQALRLLDADGILVVCCCTGLITMAMLTELLAQLAREERRTMQILERRGQAPDHPVSATCPESDYLKCLIVRVC
jgi:23S rRNA (cytosine1962-C5)-methyltransferase